MTKGAGVCLDGQFHKQDKDSLRRGAAGSFYDPHKMGEYFDAVFTVAEDFNAHQ